MYQWNQLYSKQDMLDNSSDFLLPVGKLTETALLLIP